MLLKCNKLLNKINIKLYIQGSSDYFKLLDKINIQFAILSINLKHTMKAKMVFNRLLYLSIIR